jgi:predicted Fe-Mo cluster-binding NifX family protein
MKIAITANGKGLEAQVDPRFGRCANFLVVETDTLDFEVIENTNASVGGGAGIQSAQRMADLDVKAVLTGNCGPNAFRTLEAAGIEVVTGVGGTVQEAVDQHKAGSLTPDQSPNVGSHFGTKGS